MAEPEEDKLEKQESEAAPVNKNKKYRKDKPWDHDGIDHWNIPAFTKDENPGGLLEESSFAVLFPKYREKYLREVWPAVTRALKEVGIGCELNLVEGSMTVRTTRKTWDPYMIMKARDLIKLLARSVPAPQAMKIVEDEMQCDIIKVGNIIRNKEKFVKRRQRLIGPNGSTLKAIELLTGCYMLVQGNTVSAMGPYQGLKTLRRIVEDCIKNVHPIYHIKELMIKRELAKDPELAKENWARFLPKFKKKNVKRHKPLQTTKEEQAATTPAAPGAVKEVTKKKKKEYTPFPPPQQPSKIDLQLESGEYFLNETEKRERKTEAQAVKQGQRTEERKAQRAAAFVAPKEPKSGRKGQTMAEGQSDLKNVAESLKRKAAQAAVNTQTKKVTALGAEAFLAPETRAELGRADEPKQKKHKKSLL
mmetsp:Transcript_19451/g.33641  ORF Transcript_19451/g.33641 Transcript_19451/m.33641 type:complete len:419 (-) Transcript_19451:680-1936(-)|eukprot:CAMPEP_0119102578 /NCGR_PEP_ID=MMETSP1180-20130426/1281_1 /TAXON_ID=3052 ORGANISM="Chlamydomonas cf sp, Strain CCMP681" /NCGR_SAMPLE_ID=MMETSP1180 /ASSEMBLY_ACC=CAM_ASM_000741 /LENGTH=418 /DNA_ID=CAMNT_0007086895 /DNA_START=191 /DNA_END=1447 /DNA_ORIENTATION=+